MASVPVFFKGGGPTAYGVRLTAVSPPTPVPTLTEWGMLLLAGLVAGYGRVDLAAAGAAHAIARGLTSTSGW